MTAWLVAMAVLGFTPAQEPPAPAPAQDDRALQQKVDDLSKQLDDLRRQMQLLQQDKERLARENAALRRDVDALRGMSEESAREIIMLRQALRETGAAPAARTDGKTDGAVNADANNPPSSERPGPKDGPKDVLRAKILGSNADFNFIVINKGEPDGVLPGYRFDIMRHRRDPSKPDEWRWEKLGTGEFEKYIGERNSQSKLKIIEGNAAAMRYEDEAVAQRKIEPAPEAHGAPAPAPAAKKFSITGKPSGDAFTVNYGSLDGARQSDRVFVYREGRKRAELRIDVVEKDWAIARLIDKTQNGDFGIGDEIATKEIKLAIVGRVKWNDEKRGIIIDTGITNDVRPGMKFEVRRQGRKIGVVEVMSVDRVSRVSTVKPIEPLKRDEVYVEDFVESVD